MLSSRFIFQRGTSDHLTASMLLTGTSSAYQHPSHLLSIICFAANIPSHPYSVFQVPSSPVTWLKSLAERVAGPLVVASTRWLWLLRWQACSFSCSLLLRIRIRHSRIRVLPAWPRMLWVCLGWIDVRVKSANDGLVLDVWRGMSFESLFTRRLLSALNQLYAYTPEVFPAPHRGTGDAICSAFNRITGLQAPISTCRLMSCILIAV